MPLVPPGVQGGAADASKITMVDLQRVLISAIDSDTWSEKGGRGQVQQLGTSLIVWQSPAVHKLIRDLLTQLREVTGERRTVAIDARWLLLNSDDLDRLMSRDEAGNLTVTRDVLAQFTRRPTSMRCLTNCFSGQLVYLVSGTRRNVVSGYIPVVGSLDAPESGVRYASNAGRTRLFYAAGEIGGAGGQAEHDRNVGYQPLVTTPNLGALLEIRPTLIRGGDSAIVDLKSTITVPVQRQADPETQQISPPPIVDRIAIETQELATTVRVPLGVPILVGGMTHVPSTIGMQSNAPQSAEQDDAAESRQLYLVMELR
jgi:hypothetical protein